jgi:hypothetical protein
MVTGVDGAPVEKEMLKGYALKLIVRMLAATLFKKMDNVIVPQSGKIFIFRFLKS